MIIKQPFGGMICPVQLESWKEKVIISVKVDRTAGDKLPTMSWWNDRYIGVALALFGVDGVVDGWSTTDAVVSGCGGGRLQ